MTILTQLQSYTAEQSIRNFNLLKKNNFNYSKDDAPDLRAYLIHPVLDAYTRKREKYDKDLQVGLELYELFSPEIFPMRYASDDGIWRFLSIKVLPDIVYTRFKDLKSDIQERYWKSPRRIWLKTVWWYVHLSWQGSRKDTEAVLQDLTTDEIVQLIERSGPSGYRLELCRELMKQFQYFRQNHTVKRDMFRALMKLNTARLYSIEPELAEDGIQGYVQRLFDYFEKKHG